MMIRSVIRWINVSVTAFLLAATSVSAQAEEYQLTLDQARQVAVVSLQDGRAGLARQLASALIVANPEDAEAHFLLARALQQLGNPEAARGAAVRAFRLSSDQTLKFHAAQLAARLAVETEQPMLAQIWLRRAANYVPDDQQLARLQQDFRMLRLISPLSLRGSLSVAPSNNVNNGTSSAVNIIDGVSLIGHLSDDALALSGMKAIGFAEAAYRLARDETSETRITARLDLSRVQLSEEALITSPGSSNEDFAYSQIDLGLDHRQVLEGGADVLSLGASLSHAWYAGADYMNALNLSAGLTRPLEGGGSVQGQVAASQTRPMASDPVNAVSAQLRHVVPLEQGSLSYGGLFETRASDNLNARRSRTVAFASFTPDLPGDSFGLTFSGGVALAHYPDYRVGLITVPGGRQDETRFFSADLTLKNLDLWGFVPSLRWSVQDTASNVSRFETLEQSLTYGVVSRF